MPLGSLCLLFGNALSLLGVPLGILGHFFVSFGVHYPHAPGARMTAVTQTPSNQSTYHTAHFCFCDKHWQTHHNHNHNCLHQRTNQLPITKPHSKHNTCVGQWTSLGHIQNRKKAMWLGRSAGEFVSIPAATPLSPRSGVREPRAQNKCAHMLYVYVACVCCMCTCMAIVTLSGTVGTVLRSSSAG